MAPVAAAAAAAETFVEKDVQRQAVGRQEPSWSHPLLEAQPLLQRSQATIQISNSPKTHPQKKKQKTKKPNNNDNTPKHKTKGDDLVNGGRYFPSLRSSLA
jgi:hypothetical protein